MNSTFSNHIIRIKNITKSFDERIILDGINMTVERGKTTVIMGASGCGKSTLLYHIIGYLKPDKGEIWIDNKEITNMGEEELNECRKKFGMLFQNSALLNSLTVGENVALPLKEHTKLDPNIISIIVKMKLELVGLRDFEDLKPSQLSGGMKKRVGLARSIAMDPEIVFYDEPTTGLDPIMASVIDKLVMDLSKKLKITSIAVTHDMNSAFKIADKIVMLYNGRIIQEGTSDEFRNTNNPIVEQFVHGKPDGPIPLKQSIKDYKTDLIGIRQQAHGI